MTNNREEIGKIAIYGSKADTTKTLSLLLTIPDLLAMSEGEARLKIQDLIDKHKIATPILYDGNTVWSFKRIVRNTKQIVEHGTLYNKKKPAFIPIGSMLRMPTIGDCILTDYFYNFLTNCGSIAHYNKSGWVAIYPTLDDLREFFKKNEYGKRVIDDLPHWALDRRRIVQEIEKILGIND